MRDLETIFKALSDETRLKMLGLLAQRGELCVCDFIEVLNISQSRASRHLRYLSNAGLLQDRREAVWVYYQIAEQLGPERRAVIKLVKTLSKDRLSELEARLERLQQKRGRNLSKTFQTGSCCPHPIRGKT